jgi:hypothetical protein
MAEAVFKRFEAGTGYGFVASRRDSGTARGCPGWLEPERYPVALIGELYMSLKEQEETIAALISGDSDRLAQVQIVNWAIGCKRLAKVMDISGERGSWYRLKIGGLRLAPLPAHVV